MWAMGEWRIDRREKKEAWVAGIRRSMESAFGALEREVVRDNCVSG